MSEDERAYLTELLEWVQQNAHEESVGEFVQAFARNHGETLYDLAERKPEDALTICEMLFEMVEETPEDGEEMREYFLKTQPKPQPDAKQFLL